MPISPRVLLGPLAGMDLAMTCGRISGGGCTTAEVISMLCARLLPGCAVDYDLRNFSAIFLGTDMDADDGDVIADALAECERQGVPHRILRSDPDASGDEEEIYSIIIASDQSILAYAIREFYTFYPDVTWL